MNEMIEKNNENNDEEIIGAKPAVENPVRGMNLSPGGVLSFEADVTQFDSITNFYKRDMWIKSGDERQNGAKALWAFTWAFSPSKYFPEEEMIKITMYCDGKMPRMSTRNTFEKARDLLEDLGFEVIDRTEHTGDGGKLKWSPVYEKTKGIAKWSRFEYYIAGTRYERALKLLMRSADPCFGVPCDFGYEKVGNEEENDIYDEGAPEPFPDGIYIAPYNELEYRFFTKGRDRIAEVTEFALKEKQLSFPVRFRSGRIFSIFHLYKKTYRYGFCYKGSHIIEGYDRHCAVINFAALYCKDRLPEDEFKRLYEMSKTGRLYDILAAKTCNSRDAVKVEVQKWRNDTPKRAKSHHRDVAEYMEENFPVFSEIVYNWPVYDKVDKKTGRVKRTKTIQKEINMFETEIFSQLSYYLIDKYGITPFTLHDSVNWTEEDNKKLPENIYEEIDNWFEDNILH